MTHKLKILPKWYADVESGKKNFEIRVNDRDYKVGDTLILQEYDKGGYTGRQITRKIQYIYQGNGAYGLSDEYCILGLEQEPSGDVISRQAAQAKIKSICDEYGLSYEDGERKVATGGSAYALGHAFDDLPSVTPRPKTGYWIPLGNYDDWGNERSYKCSECGDLDTYPDNFCPNCGVKMVDADEDYENKQQSAKWITNTYTDDITCPFCREVLKRNYFNNYCSNCGGKIESEE